MKLDLVAMARDAKADTADKVVDLFARRFLSVTPADRERGLLVDFLRTRLGSSTVRPSDTLEESLRELLYLVFSMPEYQVG